MRGRGGRAVQRRHAHARIARIGFLRRPANSWATCAATSTEETLGPTRMARCPSRGCSRDGTTCDEATRVRAMGFTR